MRWTTNLHLLGIAQNLLQRRADGVGGIEMGEKIDDLAVEATGV